MSEAVEELFLFGEEKMEKAINQLQREFGAIRSGRANPMILDKVYPCHEIVKIDYFLPGCPPRADLIWNALVALLTGNEMDLPYEVIKFD